MTGYDVFCRHDIWTFIFCLVPRVYTANVVELKLLSADDCTYIMQNLLTGKESKSLKYSTKKRTHPPKRQYATSNNAQYANANKK